MNKLTKSFAAIFAKVQDSQNVGNYAAAFGSNNTQSTVASPTDIYGTTSSTNIANVPFNNGWSESLLQKDIQSSYEQFNGLFFACTFLISYLYQVGINEWDNQSDYYAGVGKCQVNGIVYNCIVSCGPNVVNSPAQSPVGGSNWIPQIFADKPTSIGEVVDSLAKAQASQNLKGFNGITSSNSYIVCDNATLNQGASSYLAPLNGQMIFKADFPSFCAWAVRNGYAADVNGNITLPVVVAGKSTIQQGSGVVLLGQQTNGFLPSTTVNSTGTLNLTHTHEVDDPQHSHGVSDVGHVHDFNQSGTSTGISNSMGFDEMSPQAGSGSSSFNYFGGSGSNDYLISIAIAGSNIAVNPASTYITLQNALSSSTAVTTSGSFGSGSLNIAAGLGVNKCIRIGYLGE